MASQFIATASRRVTPFRHLEAIFEFTFAKMAIIQRDVSKSMTKNPRPVYSDVPNKLKLQ